MVGLCTLFLRGDGISPSLLVQFLLIAEELQIFYAITRSDGLLVAVVIS